MARRAKPQTADGAGLLLEFCVVGIALSAQGKNRRLLRAWKETVAFEAKKALSGSGMIDGPLELRLSQFSEAQTIDRDNFAKPIQDALQGILFLNDRQAPKLLSEWCDINGRYKVRSMSKTVAAALVRGDEFVWIRIHRHRPREALNE